MRDWILFTWPESGLKIFDPWPNFNIADSLLVTGAIMLVVHALVWREKTDDAASGEPVASAPPILLMKGWMEKVMDSFFLPSFQ